MKPRQGLCIQNDLLQCALVQYLQKSWIWGFARWLINSESWLQPRCYLRLGHVKSHFTSWFSESLCNMPRPQGNWNYYTVSCWTRSHKASHLSQIIWRKCKGLFWQLMTCAGCKFDNGPHWCIWPFALDRDWWYAIRTWHQTSAEFSGERSQASFCTTCTAW